MATIEYTVGSESHSSAWGKFYVRGLERWEVKEGGKGDKHTSYAELVSDVPDKTIFTVFDQSGDKRGTSDWTFYVCQARNDTAQCHIEGGCYRRGGKIDGSYLILCKGEGKIRAPRLMDWWSKLAEKCVAFKTDEENLKAGTRRKFAFWCAQHIEKRGLADIPPMPPDFLAEQPETSHPLALS